MGGGGGAKLVLTGSSSASCASSCSVPVWLTAEETLLSRGDKRSGWDDTSLFACVGGFSGSRRPGVGRVVSAGRVAGVLPAGARDAGALVLDGAVIEGLVVLEIPVVVRGGAMEVLLVATVL
jgi:hypothetical protein